MSNVRSVTIPVLSEDGVLVHIGPHKTGTTAIQGSLAEHRSALAAEGVLYPGRRQDHNREAAAAIQRPQGHERTVQDPRYWERLLTEVRGWQGRVVLSSEVFCEAPPGAIAKVVNDLGNDGVRVVVTVRPLERILPSSWQQHIRSGYTVSFPHWLNNVLTSRDDSHSGPTFWTRNDHPALIRRWGEVVGSENITVVVVDDSDRGGIFGDFEAILGLPAGALTPQASHVANRSLSLPEVEVLRHLNARVRKGMSDADYLDFVKRGAVQKIIQGRVPGPDEARLVLPGWAVRRARDLADSYVTEITDLGVTVIGDLALLAPTTPIIDDDVTAPCTEVPMDVTVGFMASLLQAAIETRDKDARQEPAHTTVTHQAKTIAHHTTMRAAQRLQGLRRRLEGAVPGTKGRGQ